MPKSLLVEKERCLKDLQNKQVILMFDLNVEHNKSKCNTQEYIIHEIMTYEAQT
jgi:hypothetical protein